MLDAARRLPPAGLTMRALGRELGVTHGAIYRYFPDLKAVLAALAAEVAEAMTPPSPDLSWDDWLKQCARALRQVIREHPDLLDPATWSASAPATYHMITVGLTVLKRTFDPSDALVALGVVSRFATCFAWTEPALKQVPPLPLSDELLAALTDVEPILDLDVLFERELEVVIAGIDATLAKLTDPKLPVSGQATAPGGAGKG